VADAETALKLQFKELVKMGKVVNMPFRLRHDAQIDEEAVIRADLNPAMYYACKRMLENPELLKDSASLTTSVLNSLEGHDVAVMLTALYGAIDIVSGSWLMTNGCHDSSRSGNSDSRATHLSRLPRGGARGGG